MLASETPRFLGFDRRDGLVRARFEVLVAGVEARVSLRFLSGGQVLDFIVDRGLRRELVAGTTGDPAVDEALLRLAQEEFVRARFSRVETEFRGRRGWR